MKKHFSPFIYFSVALAALFFTSCQKQKNLVNENTPVTWAEKLNFPKGAKVIMLHADDIGMCEEANIAAIHDLTHDWIQSAAVMMPCEYADEIIEWAKQNPAEDIGLHLTLTSEWKTWRWGTVTAE